jgi:hypothetical protein
LFDHHERRPRDLLEDRIGIPDIRQVVDPRELDDPGAGDVIGQVLRVPGVAEDVDGTHTGPIGLLSI